MRTEKEIFDLVLETARTDERVRGVFLSGSRTNFNVTPDIFQDYDVVYIVQETASFRACPDWIDRFGPRLLLQMPEEMSLLLGHPCQPSRCYGYLMLLADGVRIDLRLQTFDYALEEIARDKLFVILLDKDGVLPSISSSDVCHWVSRPTQEEFTCCCNEFWWLQNNVAKGLWRQEAVATLDHINLYLRPQLLTLLSWYAGILTGFCRSVGKGGKYLGQMLPQEIWSRYLSTYPPAELSPLWITAFTMCSLFDSVAEMVAWELNLSYDTQEATAGIRFLKNAYSLPRNATEVL